MIKMKMKMVVVVMMMMDFKQYVCTIVGRSHKYHKCLASGMVFFQQKPSKNHPTGMMPDRSAARRQVRSITRYYSFLGIFVGIFLTFPRLLILAGIWGYSAIYGHHDVAG